MNKVKVVLVASALVSGAVNTLGFTLQNKQSVNEGSISKHFFHPYIQTALRYLSYIFCLLLHLTLQHRRKLKKQVISQQEQQQNAGNQKPNLLLYVKPTLIDYVATLCYYTALNFIPGSVYQILRGGTIITTYFFSYKFLGSRPDRVKLLGCLIILAGLIGVGVVNFLFSASSISQQVLTLIGYGLILLALFGNGLHFVYQQYLMTKYKAKPLFIVGMEGLYGVIVSSILIPLLGLAPCSFGVQACVYQQSGAPIVQSISIFIKEMLNNGAILSGVILVLICSAVYNSLGVTIAKQMSSLTRSICDASRTVIIWIVGLIVSSFADGDKSLQWESLNGWQILGQGVCFGILIMGNLIYYGLIKVGVQAKSESLLQEEYEPSITTQS